MEQLRAKVWKNLPYCVILLTITHIQNILHIYRKTSSAGNTSLTDPYTIV
jgi:hypothetical protein